MNVPRHLTNGRTLQLSGWTATGRVIQGRGRPAQQQSPRCLSISNLIMSSTPLQPERHIWNLCSVLLANDLGNARQEQRKIVVFLLCPNLSSPREQTCMSLLFQTCTQLHLRGELWLSTHAGRSWMPHHKQEAVGMHISHPQLKALSDKLLLFSRFNAVFFFF